MLYWSSWSAETVFRYILAQFKCQGDIAALTSRPNEQEVNQWTLNNPPPRSLFSQWGQQSTISSIHKHTHTQNFQFTWEHVDTHTLPCHNTHRCTFFPRAENPNYTTVATSKLSDLPSQLFSPSVRPLSWSTQVQNPRLLSSICQIKFNSKEMTNMVQCST